MLTTQARVRTAARQFWGDVNSVKKIAPGVWGVDGVGHGGIVVSTEVFPLPTELVGLDGNVANWRNSLTGDIVLTLTGFEEDCAWGVLMHRYPELIAPAIGKYFAADCTVEYLTEHALNAVKSYYPRLLQVPA